MKQVENRNNQEDNNQINHNKHNHKRKRYKPNRLPISVVSKSSESVLSSNLITYSQHTRNICLDVLSLSQIGYDEYNNSIFGKTAEISEPGSHKLNSNEHNKNDSKDMKQSKKIKKPKSPKKKQKCSPLWDPVDDHFTVEKIVMRRRVLLNTDDVPEEYDDFYDPLFPRSNLSGKEYSDPEIPDYLKYPYRYKKGKNTRPVRKKNMMVTKYRIRWQGYTEADDTDEFAFNIHQDIVKQFEKLNPRTKK